MKIFRYSYTSVKYLTIILFSLVLTTSIQAETFTVTKTADTNDNVCNTDCSLREAIAAANASSTDDVIEFDATIFNSIRTILLTGTRLQIESNGSLIINGTGSGLLTVSGNLLSTVFVIEPNATATINGLKIADGRQFDNAPGGGILNQLGNLTINNSIITGNQSGSGSEGGGIYNCGGNVTLNGSTVTNNSAGSNGGGGIASGDNCVSGRPNSLTINNSVISNNTTTGSGGGINNRSVLNITNTIINNNSAYFGGGIISTEVSNLTTVTIQSNTATQNGGGVHFGSLVNRLLTIIDSTITGNSSGTKGGGISCSENSRLTVTNSSFRNNSSVQGGGGLYGFRAIINVTASTFSGNNTSGGTSTGGGIYSESLGQLNLNSSIMNNNSAKNGGGIFSDGSTVSVNGSTVNNNSASGGNGGGIGKLNGDFTITNSTVSNNTANNGGGIHFSNFNTLNLINSTISGNTATADGGGIYNNNTGTINARNTLIGDNITNSGSTPDFRGNLNSQGYNLVENTGGTNISGLTVGNIIGQDPQILPLRNNGGANQTVGLKPSSPAIDAADPGNFSQTDQRGIPRSQDGDINGSALPDIGAYERQIAFYTVTKSEDTNDNNCDSDCSLREAIAATAAAATPDNAVIFDSTFSQTARTITLSNGQLSISNGGTLVISGSGIDSLNISGNNVNRVFLINTGASVLIQKLTISGGNDTSQSGFNGGGGVRVEGFLALNDAAVINNKATNFGGGVYARFGQILINNCNISNNNSGSGGGGIFINVGTVSVRNTSFRQNISNQDGGAIENGIGTLTAHNIVVRENTANRAGGGISNESTMTITDSIIHGNRSVISSAIGGGGIFSDGSFTGRNLTVSGNSAVSGGGIFIRDTDTIVNLSNSAIVGNSAVQYGGGIYNQNAVLNLTNSTIAGNVVSSNSSPEGLGGGIFNTSFSTALTNVTVAENSAGIGGGGIRNGSSGDGSGTLNMKNSIVANNWSPVKQDFDGNLTSQGYNLIETVSGTIITGITTGNILGQDPKLGALASNRGTTQTFSLLPGSPAIDAADPSSFLPTDQRGFTRPQDGDQNNSALPDIGAFERYPLIDNRAPYDFDGDGKSDIGIFRPAGGEWWINRSSTNVTVAAQFGSSTDRIVPADFTGDGKADMAFWRPSNGFWFILRSEDFSFYGFNFGAAGDVPVAADFDGDGKADQAVFRPSNQGWYIQKSSGGIDFLTFGLNGDSPVAADYDGDGKADIAVTRINAGSREWWIRRSSDNQIFSVVFGDGADQAVPGDYTGDGKADIAFWRESNGFWYILRSENLTFYGFPFGTSGDTPTPGDYDGDGKFDAAVFRESNSGWYQLRSTQGFTAVTFGLSNDIPVSSAFVP